LTANWFKGNLHTHTTLSDGDAPPDIVAAWYEQHGYDFLRSRTRTDVKVVASLARSAHLMRPC
jgi:predicted metal-dependent phosphoesterase TrpH